MNKTKIIMRISGFVVSCFSLFGAFEISQEIGSMSPFYLVVPIIFGIGLVGSACN